MSEPSVAADFRAMRVLAFVNQKGGCGKTTTSVQLAASLAQRGRRVLLVDLDPQAHATLSLGVDAEEQPSMVDVLSDEVPIDRVVVDAPGGFLLGPAAASLAEFEEVSERMIFPERVLDAALEESTGGYDYVLLDCPPRADGVLTANALRASDTAVLVVECGAFALQGALKARRILERIADQAGARLQTRVVATLFDRRTRFSRELLIGMHARFGRELFDTAIRTSVRLREAVAYGVPVQLLEPHGKAAEDFAALADELIALESEERAPGSPTSLGAEELRVVETTPPDRPTAPRPAEPARLSRPGERLWTP